MPGIGRFVQEDMHAGKLLIPITTINKYVYVGNNPLRFVDANGLFFGSLMMNLGKFIEFSAAATIGLLGGFIAANQGNNQGASLFESLSALVVTTALTIATGGIAIAAFSAVATATAGIGVIGATILGAVAASGVGYIGGYVTNGLNQYIMTGKVNWARAQNAGLAGAALVGAGTLIGMAGGLGMVVSNALATFGANCADSGVPRIPEKDINEGDILIDCHYNTTN